MSQQQSDRQPALDRAALDEGLDALARRLEEWLSEARDRSRDLKGALAEAIATARPMAPAPAGVTEGSDEWEALAEAVRQMEAQANQAAILGRMIESAAQLAQRIALFVCRGPQMTVSAARGLPEGVALRSIVLEAGSSSAVEAARTSNDFVMEEPASRPGNAALLAALGGGEVAWMLAAPLWIRDKVAAVLYADTNDNDDWHPEAIRVLASVAALSLEAVPARTKHPRPQPAPRSVTGQFPAIVSTAPSAGPVPGPAPEAGRPAGAEPTPDEEEARRFARLLTSEIVLYNAAQIEEGRRRKDLYERLRDDIDRSHRMYEERISGRTPAAAGIFRDELIRTLADGDASAIQLPWD